MFPYSWATVFCCAVAVSRYNIFILLLRSALARQYAGLILGTQIKEV